MANRVMNKAKKAKKDEFYTQSVDVEEEMKYYRDQGHFKNKVIYCNCDDPEESSFWKYFRYNFDFLGLKKLISTHYKEDESTYKLEYDGTSTKKTNLEGNGDFRNKESIELLKECDIVATNPPFSLFREYVAQLMEHNKKFIIMGNNNAITYKEFFPLLKDNKVWLGQHANKTMEFGVPDDYPLTGKGGRVDKNGNKFIKVPAISWFTNLDIPKRHEDIILFKEYNEKDYPKYDNYDAINVDKVNNIPKDYYGTMGVPITFLTKHNPNQFEIVGMTTGREEFGIKPSKRYINAKQINRNGSITNGSKANTRATIRLKEKSKKIYYTADNAKYPMEIKYARILVKRRYTNW